MVRFDREKGAGPWSHDADSYHSAMMLLTASDNAMSDRLATALLQVKGERLHQREGHARWSTYLRAYVGPTECWWQQEMKRVRQLREYPLLGEAWSKAEISKAQLRVLLPVVTPETEVRWLESARATNVRLLDRMAREVLLSRRKVKPADGASSGRFEAAAEDDDEPCGRRRCRTVMAPAPVAQLVAEAVDVARKLEGYHIGAGAAVSLMASETMTALGRWADEPSAPIEGNPSRPQARSLLGDELDLRRESGRFWETAHELAEVWQRREAKLSREVIRRHIPSGSIRR